MPRQYGFTLVELLIAMTLTGIILVLLYGGLRLGMRSWDVGEQRAHSMDEQRIVHEFIRLRLRESLTIYRTSEEGRVPAFVGNAEGVQFVTPMLEHLGRGGLYEVTFDVVEVNETKALRMQWLPFQANNLDTRLGAQAQEIEPEETLLLSGVSDVEWAYFGAEQVGDEPEWSERWESLQQRPLLVRLTLRLEELTWPDLVVRLQ